MEVPDLRVTLLQNDLFWENPEANRQQFETTIGRLSTPTDLLVLPEMFTTGFSMHAPALAETMDGPTVSWLQKMAAQSQAAITGSLIVQENGRYFNRLVWAEPDGTVRHYDKRHLFRMAQENAIYSAGETRLTLTWKGWNICPLICYDLRFPVWSRQHPENPYDLLLYVANWPEKRIQAWRTLLAARAIENQAYTIGVNRTGKDPNGISYNGNSGVCLPRGDAFYLPSNPEIIHTQTLSYQDLKTFREQFPAYLDADPFALL